MAFLTINGFEVSVLDGSADVSEEEIGSSSRAFSGHLLQSTRARARVFSGTTPILTSANAKAIAGLLKADGHYWEFVDQYSSKGLGVASGSYTLGASQITIGSGNTVTFDTNIGSAWTVIAHDSGSVSTFSLDSVGTEYEGGSPSSGNDNMFDVVSGDLNLYGTNQAGVNASMTWDWVVVLPFVATTSMHEEFTNLNDFSETPALTVSGNALKSESVTMRLRHGSLSEELIQFMSGGSIATGFQIAFTLEEVL
jgi:hypothetical protein